MSLVEEARTVRARIVERLRELEPLVREYDELRKLAAEMGVETPSEKASSAAAAGPRTRSRAGSPRITANTGESSPTSANAGGEAGQHVLEAVRAEPGKTVADYAEGLNVAPASLYRPVRELTKSGALVKRGRQLFPA